MKVSEPGAQRRVLCIPRPAPFWAHSSYGRVPEWAKVPFASNDLQTLQIPNLLTRSRYGGAVDVRERQVKS